MGRRFGGSLVVCLALAAMAGCGLSFPAVSKPRTYRCQQASDCAPGYGCVAGYCSAGGGTTGDGGTVTDGGATDGGATDAGATDAGVTDAGATDAGATDAGASDAGVTDGGVTDGGLPLSSCSYDMAVSPDVVPANLAVPITVDLPSGVTASAAQVASQGMGAPAVNQAPWRFTLPTGLNTGATTSAVFHLRVDDDKGGCFRTPITAMPDASPTTLTASPAQGPAQTPFPISLTLLSGNLTPDDPVWVYAIAGTSVHAVGQVEKLPTGTIRAVVPKLPSGTYRLLLVAGIPSSPILAETGSNAGLQVVSGSLPAITSVVPAEIPVSSAGTAIGLVLHGSGFAVNGQVRIECGGHVGPWHTLLTTNVSGAHDVVTTNVGVPGAVVAGDRCLVRYQSSGTPSFTATHGGMFVADDSGNAPAKWMQVQFNLQAQVRDAGAAIATLPDGSRYLVVAGGIGGGGAPLASTQVAELNDDGSLVARPIPGFQPIAFVAGTSLPAAVSRPAVAADGACIYVMGGDGSAGTPTTTIYRASILSRSQRPVGVTAAVIFPTPATTGLTKGDTYFYAVSADCEAGETPTIGVESPGSVPVEVWIPTNADQNVQVHISWGSSSHCTASAYTIYRGRFRGALQAVFTTGSGATTSWTDDNTSTPGQSAPPEPGQLSKWATLKNETLSSPRAGAAAAVVPPSGTTPAQLVVAGGEGASSTLSDMDRWPIQIPVPMGQSLGTHSDQISVLQHGRTALQGRVIRASLSTDARYASTTPWVVFGPGHDQSGTPIRDVDGYDVARTSSPGSTSTLTQSDPMIFLGLGGVDVLVLSSASTLEYWVPYDLSSSQLTLGSWRGTLTTPAEPATYLPGMASAEDAGDCYLLGGQPTGGGASGIVERTTR